MRQAEDRVHRIGQTKPVLIKRLVSVGTIEEGIKDLLVAKEEVFRFVIDGEAGSHLAGMPLDQLLSLVGLRQGQLKAMSCQG